MLIPTMASPRFSDTFASLSGSLKKVVASTMARALSLGSPDLKTPEPTKIPSHPSCIIKAASAGVASAACCEIHDGEFSALGNSEHKVVGRLQRLRLGHHLVDVERRQPSDLVIHFPHMADGLDHVARAGLAFGTNHGGTFSDPAKSFSEVASAAHERHRESRLSMWFSSPGLSTSDSST